MKSLVLFLVLVSGVAMAQTLPPIVVKGTNVIKEHAVEQEHALRNFTQTCMDMDMGADNSADSSTSSFEGAEKFMHMGQCQSAQVAAETHVVELCKTSKKPADVIQACTEVLDLKMLNKGYEYLPLTDRALAFITTGDFKNAVRDLTAAITLNPKSAVAFYLRADARARLGDPTAVSDLQMAVSLDPSLAKLITINHSTKTVTMALPPL